MTSKPSSYPSVTWLYPAAPEQFLIPGMSRMPPVGRQKPGSTAQAGDTLPIGLLAVSALLSAGAIAILIAYKQRKRAGK